MYGMFNTQRTIQERPTGAGFAALHQYSTQICNITVQICH